LEQVKIGSEVVHIRPGTPDIDVATSCFKGEYDAALNAVKLQQFQFIVDAGGYIGTAAMVFARAFPSATVVTLEPSIANFAVLKRNVSPFANIVAINKALNSQCGRLQLMDRWAGTWGFSTYDVADANCPDPVLLHSTDALTIPCLLKQFGKNGIDILKLDIEGAELEIFNSSASWIERTSVIFVELHERFRAGCETAFIEATKGRTNSIGQGEKVLSVAS
jgi:FkbM family methyltransferase